MLKMINVSSKSEFASLFSMPFEPKKVIYSLNSEFFRDGNAICKVREKQLGVDVDEEELLHNPFPEFPCGEAGCRAVFTTVHDYEIHYRSVHNLVCSECKKTFPTYNLLDIHIQEKHDTYYETAKEKKRAFYACIIEGCCDTFSSKEMRNEHVIKIHNYPPDFRFQDLKDAKKMPEKMDVAHEEMPQANSFKSVRPHLRNVPRQICFGRGSIKTFKKERKKTSSRDITMKELADAL